MCYAKQVKSLVESQEFQALQTQAEQLHSADQAAIVIEGAAVTSKPTEVLGKLGTVSLRKKSYQCIQTIEVPCAQYTPCKASVHDNHIMAMMIISIISIRIQR